MSKVFSPDQRNLGGRRIILQQMLQHLHHVETAKSTLSQTNSSSKLLRRTPSPVFKFLDQYKEVLNTFDKVQKIQQKRPSVEKFKNNYFLKKVQTTNTEHQKNFEKCKKRIQEMNNKNKTTLNPALFFRRVDKSLINKTCPIKQSTSIQQVQPRPQKKEIQQEIDWESIAKKIPQLADPLFKNKITDLIVSNRIYSDDDYAFLVCLISSVNNAEQSKIILIMSQILNELGLL
ncbi:unnamed protein product (macronuclear) [Paramecium tetraurelia]|uniref:Uncharacterized protein n=1 Tax=Paramecium tetraurelia TaxID=5888 RepID=A0E218_PARTE|nr:uncharacterized protein GSPATT00022506001 [Paramecium tetraurelia]CAK89335.1 unnamed protein product [Paramecium tetraurelia]|eukprot:XP_001456732.1 hypothetical protein (macronuclear) [Paramecium tetraurelia strain d4-2]